MSTPPTSLGDEHSVLSDAAKMDLHVETQEDTVVVSAQREEMSTPQPTSEALVSEGRRSARSSRGSVTTYNVSILAGTAIHTPTKYLEKHHKNVLHGPLEAVLKANSDTPPKRRAIKLEPEDISDPAEAQLAIEAAQAAQRRKSARGVDLRKETLVSNATATVAQKGSELLSGVKNRVQHALRGSRTQSRTAASDSISVKSSLKRTRRSGAAETEDEETEQEEEKDYVKPKTKKWEPQGLFVGQHRDFNARLNESQNRKKKSKKAKKHEVLPLPMFSGEAMLNGDYRRDFKLPFDTYHPLPRKVKVDGWVKLSKSEFCAS